MTEEVHMGATITDSTAEQDMREYLLRNCQAIHLHPSRKPYLVLKSPTDWSEKIEKVLTGGRVIRIMPIETYGDYIVKRD